jgi:hypothetical protein
MISFQKNIIKAGELLAKAHKAHVELGMLLSDISLGKLINDTLIEHYIKIMKDKKVTAAQFRYSNSEENYRVTVSKIKRANNEDSFKHESKRNKNGIWKKG